jgi:recombination protein RecR
MNSIEKLVDIFKNFPTVGPRTARRFVYYLIKLPKEEINKIILVLQELKNKIRLCQLCFNPYEEVRGPASNQLCSICSNQRRDRNLLCIVEKEADLLSIENTKKYTGLYFILGGTVATMRKEDLNNLRIEELKKRIKGGKFSEVIVALNPTPEGRATSILVENSIKEVIPSPTFKITHLAKGIPVGGELEYADDETLQSALEGRK